MKSFKFFWNAHKWTGLACMLVLTGSAVTGFLLLIKKKVDWIQPPTHAGAPGELEQFISTQQLFESVFAHQHPNFTQLDDVDRVDFRPADRVFKVVSRHDYAELQVCAVTGEVLHEDWRPSDLLEDLHDGSFFAGWVHAWVMPVVACGLVFLAGSGVWLWIEPIVRRARRRRASAAG